MEACPYAADISIYPLVRRQAPRVLVGKLNWLHSKGVAGSLPCDCRRFESKLWCTLQKARKGKDTCVMSWQQLCCWKQSIVKCMYIWQCGTILHVSGFLPQICLYCRAKSVLKKPEMFARFFLPWLLHTNVGEDLTMTKILLRSAKH